MALSARLQMRQTQSLVMTPQLLQSIRLLQYGRSELKAFVEQEMERNPLLEPAAGYATAAPEEAGANAHAAAEGKIPTSREHDDGSHAGASAARQDGDADHPAADIADPGSDGEGKAGATGFGERPHFGGGDFRIEDLAEGKPSLRNHALAEVADAVPAGLDRKLGEAMAENLDENGYLRLPAEDIASELGADPASVERVLVALQAEANPPGLFARDLAECLGIQLQRRNRLDPVMRIVLSRLDLLARRDFATLRRLTGEDEADLMDILAEIRALDPKPGHAFDADGFEAIIPDVIVSSARDGGWRIELNPEALPRVLVDRNYLAKVKGGVLSQADQTFIGECQQSANWLVRSLDQRARTIVKVATEIVKRQDGFLSRGVGALKPMTLMSVAEAIGMHESTVSRVTAAKFIATPRGTFEMRFFFTVAIASANGGDAHSAESVKHRIKQMIDTETQGNVLSDDDIAATLNSEGVDLARRTVAKYREALGLPSSIQRRREMNARRMAG